MTFAGVLALSAGAIAQSAKPTPAPAGSQPAPFKLIVQPQALALLKQSSAHLAAAKSMSFTAVVSYEFPSRLGPPLVYTVRNDVTMQRPDKLRIITPGDGPASDLYYDGRTMMAYSPAPGLVAIAKAPPTLDAAMRAAFQDAAIYYPFTDLILSDPYAALTHGTVLAFYIGKSNEVGDTQTDMVAWANDDVFLQIWIGTKDKLPRRIRAIYRKDPLQLRHQMDLSNWQIDPVIAAGTFQSRVAQSARQIAFANPGAKPPPIGTPLFMQTPSTPAKAPATASKPAP